MIFKWNGTHFAFVQTSNSSYTYRCTLLVLEYMHICSDDTHTILSGRDGTSKVGGGKAESLPEVVRIDRKCEV
jgi:hypothetical protein